jgi:predicted RNase H-like HicB family nuclease
MMVDRYSAQIVWSDEDGGYIAMTPELDGISAFGDTPAAALAELSVARSLWLDEVSESGRQAPDPLSLPAYSGQFRLRIPRTLHAWLAARAHIEGVSLNTFVVQLLSEGRGAHESRSSTNVDAPSAARS